MITMSVFSSFWDIVFTSILLYILYFFFKGTYTETIVKGLFFAMILYILSKIAHLNTIQSIFKRFFNDLPIVIAILFHQELRHFLSNLGRNHHKIKTSVNFSTELAQSLLSMSYKGIGALIIVERNMKLNEFFTTGVLLDAHFNPVLIQTIFYKGSLLHDGAVIIRNEQILAAKVFLPTTFSPESTGTRHGAGISITKERDCVSFIISEETGAISYAKDGILTPIPALLIEEIIYEVLA